MGEPEWLCEGLARGRDQRQALGGFGHRLKLGFRLGLDQHPHCTELLQPLAVGVEPAERLRIGPDEKQRLHQPGGFLTSFNGAGGETR